MTQSNSNNFKKRITIAVNELSPLVMKRGKQFFGFEIELWENIARKLKINFCYKKVAFSKIFHLIRDGGADVALAGITINKAREEIIDFSHSTLESGLLIIVAKNKNWNIFSMIINLVRDGYKKILETFSYIIFFIVIFGNIVWFAERGVGTFNAQYFPGIFESFWWAIVTMSTVGYGDFVPHSWLGRIFSIMVILGGYIIFGFFIAETSSLITLSRLKNNINSYGDLAGKTVATVEQTVSVDALEEINSKVVTVKNIEKAYKKLKNGMVDAVVFDAPVLLYFIRKGGAKDFEIVGDLFRPHAYGIVVNENAIILREAINRVLLEIRESGEYDALYRKWFGDNTKLE